MAAAATWGPRPVNSPHKMDKTTMDVHMTDIATPPHSFRSLSFIYTQAGRKTCPLKTHNIPNKRNPNFVTLRQKIFPFFD